MTGLELLAYVRTLIFDTKQPYLWPDSVIMRFMREAERIFCARTHILQKNIPLAVVANQASHKVPNTVLKIYAVAINDNMLSPLTANAIHIHYAKSSGEPRAFSTGLDMRTITLYPVPDTNYTLDLYCAVYPDTPLDLSTEPAVPLEYQHALCDYAAYKCLESNEVDGTNEAAASKFLLRWHESLLEAKREYYYYRTPNRIDIPSWTGGK